MQCFPVLTFSWCFSLRRMGSALGNTTEWGGLTEIVYYLVSSMTADLGKAYDTVVKRSGCL